MGNHCTRRFPVGVALSRPCPHPLADSCPPHFSIPVSPFPWAPGLAPAAALAAVVPGSGRVWLQVACGASGVRAASERAVPGSGGRASSLPTVAGPLCAAIGPSGSCLGPGAGRGRGRSRGGVAGRGHCGQGASPPLSPAAQCPQRLVPACGPAAPGQHESGGGCAPAPPGRTSSRPGRASALLHPGCHPLPLRHRAHRALLPTQDPGAEGDRGL